MKYIVLLPTLIVLWLSVCKAEDKNFDQLPTVTDTIRFNNFEYSFEKNFVSKGYKHQKRQQDTSYYPNWYFECVEKKEEGYIEAYIYSNTATKSRIKVYFYPKHFDKDSIRVDLKYSGDTIRYENAKSEFYDQFQDMSENSIHIQHFVAEYNKRIPTDDLCRAWITKSDKDFVIVSMLQSFDIEEFDKNLYHLCKTANSIRQINDTFDLSDKVKLSSYFDILQKAYESDDDEVLCSFLDKLAEYPQHISHKDLNKKPDFEKQAYKLYEEFISTEVIQNRFTNINSKFSLPQYLICQKELEIIIVDEIHLDNIDKNNDLYDELREESLDTISAFTIKQFIPRFKDSNVRIIYNSKRLESKFNDYLMFKHWSKNYDVEHIFLFELIFNRIEFINKRLKLSKYHHSIAGYHWDIESQPTVSIIFNKKLDKAIIESYLFGEFNLDLLIKDKERWRIEHSGGLIFTH